MKGKSSNILDPINHLHPEEHKWFAIYTKYKCEKYVVEQLSQKGISAYVPLIQKTKKYTSRIKRYEVPLINSYVFVKITKGEYVSVLETEYVRAFIKQRKNLISIPDEEINLLKMVVGEIENVEAGSITLEKGDEVEIISGNLTGIKGKLIDKEGNHRFIIQLTTVGMQLAMTVEKSKLRVIRKRAFATSRT